MGNDFDEEFEPSYGTRRTLRWAADYGATTLGEAYDMLEQLELSNDVPEVLGEDGTVEEVRDELAFGLEVLGPDAPLTPLVQRPARAAGVVGWPACACSTSDSA